MAYIGSCPDMCPESERQARFGSYMSIFERDRENQPDEYAMVKEYRRSGADQKEPEPQDLRTLEALRLTMDYLASTIMDDTRSKSQELALDWYDFLWDRLRAIRKDITQQNMCDQAAAILVEQCARFHVHCCYAMNRVKDFDTDMNKRNLNDCLQMLRQMYTDLKNSSGLDCPGECEFQTYDILLHLGEDYLSSNVLFKTSNHRYTNEMRFITRIFNSYTNNDYYRFFRYMAQADYMTSCLLSLYANRMRIIGLRSITHACASRQPCLYPSELLIECLGFDGPNDLHNFATALNIEMRTKDLKSYVVLNKELVSKLRRTDSSLPAFKSSCLVENKMLDKHVGELVTNIRNFEPARQPQIPRDITPDISILNDTDISEPTTIPEDTEDFVPATIIEEERVAPSGTVPVIVPDEPKLEEPAILPLEDPDIGEPPTIANSSVVAPRTMTPEFIPPITQEIVPVPLVKRTREEISDLMPVGHFKKINIPRKRQQKIEPPTIVKKTKTINPDIDMLRKEIEEEKKMNEFLLQLPDITRDDFAFLDY